MLTANDCNKECTMTTETQRNGAALRVGWIGAGRMGAAMAARARPGRRGPHRLEPHARPRPSRWRTPARKVADDDRRAADRDVVFTMVSTSADLEQVLSVRAACSPTRPRRRGSSSTARRSPPRRRRAIRAACAERGVDFLASPVSGNGKVVARRQAEPGRVRSARDLRPRSRRCSSHIGRPSPTSARARWPGW